MVLELFDVTQAIVNNYPEFYLGNSEVVLCEDVPSLDGLLFDIMMFKQKYENTTSTFLVIEDYDIVRASKGLMPSFAGNMFNPDGFSPKYERESYQKDMYKRNLSFHNSQINVINHGTKYYATLLFCAFVGYTHYSNSSETGETDDHSQLVLASFSTKVRKTTVK